jgi:hypothetical protein
VPRIDINADHSTSGVPVNDTCAYFTVTTRAPEHSELLEPVPVPWALHTRQSCVSEVPVFTSIVNEVELLKVGEVVASAHRAPPLIEYCTQLCEVKPVPIMVAAITPPPCPFVKLFGVIELTVGVGLETVTTTVPVAGDDVLPFWSVTVSVMVALPAPVKVRPHVEAFVQYCVPLLFQT